MKFSMLRNIGRMFLILGIFIPPIIAGLVPQVSAQEQTAPASAEEELCELKIEGKFVERLVLAKKLTEGYNLGMDIVLNNPGPSVKLPAGKYHIQQIHLQGGYKCIPAMFVVYREGKKEEYGWFEISPSKPYTLRIGAPMAPKMLMARNGQNLVFAYHLLDQEGRMYANINRALIPSFTVSRNGEVIGSGSEILGRYG